MLWAEKPDHDGVTHLTLLDVCQNLVVLDEELGVLRTAHFSVTEFLLKKVGIREARTAASEVCLTLLGKPCPHDTVDTHTIRSIPNTRPNTRPHTRPYTRPYTKPQTENHVLDNFASRDYVMDYWAEHIRLSGDGEEYKRGNEEVVKLLLKQEGVVLNAKDIFGKTPLYIVASQGHEAVVRLLLEQEGVDLNAKDENGRTPRFRAAKNSYTNIVELFDEAIKAREKAPSGQRRKRDLENDLIST
ncbi:hypothetical protein RUND412_010940 [Rhizina undulata]